MVFRAIAWAALGSADPQRELSGAGCGAATTGPAGRIAELRRPGWALVRRARLGRPRWAKVRLFGDERSGGDTVPDRGRSLLRPALIAAVATDRPVVVVTDGEVEDASDLAADVLGRASVPRLSSRYPARSRRLRGDWAGAGHGRRFDRPRGRGAASGRRGLGEPAARVLSGSKRVGSQTVRMNQGSGRARIAVPSLEVGPGDHVLRVQLAGRRRGAAHRRAASPRHGRRRRRVSCCSHRRPTGTADFSTARCGMSRSCPCGASSGSRRDRWRSMTDLRPVPAERVRQAARRADLLILKGNAAPFAQGATARGIWRWPTGGEGQGTAWVTGISRPPTHRRWLAPCSASRSTLPPAIGPRPNRLLRLAIGSR